MTFQAALVPRLAREACLVYYVSCDIIGMLAVPKHDNGRMHTMSILSDRSIRAMITEGKLVTGGDLKRIAHSAYQFVAGKIFPAGEGGEPLNWTNDLSGSEEFLVPPGGLVWVRTRESIRMPNDLCGFWFQTNSLAREGLMLVNLSIVDPGYEGPLACNFVNFGKQPILITPSTPLAKMIFARLDANVENPFRATTERGKYDETLRKHSFQAPVSFLQITEMASKLSRERDDALVEIRGTKDNMIQELTKELKRDLDSHTADLKTQLKTQREAEWTTLNSDLARFVWKSLGAGAGVFLVAALLWSLMPKVGDFLGGAAINDKISAAVEKEVARRTVLLLEQGGQGKTAPAAATGTPTTAATSAPPAVDAGAPDASGP